MQGIGQISSIKALPARNGNETDRYGTPREPLYSISIEGFSMLAGEKMIKRLTPLDSLDTLTNKFLMFTSSVKWRSGARPIHFLKDANVVNLLALAASGLAAPRLTPQGTEINWREHEPDPDADVDPETGEIEIEQEYNLTGKHR